MNQINEAIKAVLSKSAWESLRAESKTDGISPLAMLCSAYLAAYRGPAVAPVVPQRQSGDYDALAASHAERKATQEGWVAERIAERKSAKNASPLGALTQSVLIRFVDETFAAGRRVELADGLSWAGIGVPAGSVGVSQGRAGLGSCEISVLFGGLQHPASPFQEEVVVTVPFTSLRLVFEEHGELVEEAAADYQAEALVEAQNFELIERHRVITSVFGEMVFVDAPADVVVNLLRDKYAGARAPRTSVGQPITQKTDAKYVDDFWLDLIALEAVGVATIGEFKAQVSPRAGIPTEFVQVMRQALELRSELECASLFGEDLSPDMASVVADFLNSSQLLATMRLFYDAMHRHDLAEAVPPTSWAHMPARPAVDAEPVLPRDVAAVWERLVADGYDQPSDRANFNVMAELAPHILDHYEDLVGHLKRMRQMEARPDQIKAVEEYRAEQAAKLPPADVEALAMPVDALGLGGRVAHALQRAKINTVEQLVSWTPSRLLLLPSFGEGSLAKVQEKLAKMGLKLAEDVEAPSQADAAPAVSESEVAAVAEDATDEQPSSEAVQAEEAASDEASAPVAKPSPEDEARSLDLLFETLERGLAMGAARDFGTLTKKQYAQLIGDAQREITWLTGVEADALRAKYDFGSWQSWEVSYCNDVMCRMIMDTLNSFHVTEAQLAKAAHLGRSAGKDDEWATIEYAVASFAKEMAVMSWLEARRYLVFLSEWASNKVDETAAQGGDLVEEPADALAGFFDGEGGDDVE